MVPGGAVAAPFRLWPRDPPSLVPAAAPPPDSRRDADTTESALAAEPG